MTKIGKKVAILALGISFPLHSVAAQGWFDNVFRDKAKSIEKSAQDVGRSIEKAPQDVGKRLEGFGLDIEKANKLEQFPINPCIGNPKLPQCTGTSGVGERR